MDAQQLLEEDLQKFRNYQEDIERQVNLVQSEIYLKSEENKKLDDIVAFIEEEIRAVHSELRQIKDEVEPMRGQKAFIVKVAEDFVYSKNRNVKSFQQRRKKQIKNSISSNIISNASS